MSHVPTLFDRLIEDIAAAGEQLTALAACEGSAGNISVFTTKPLACPLEAVADIDLPAPAPSLAGGWVLITASGRRLRDVGRRPASTVAALQIHGSGESATMHAAPHVRPSSEWNSHVAIHEDQRSRRGVDHHAIVHAQPLRLVFLSHLPDITTTEELNERLMRWEPETTVVAADGVELAPFQVPGSPEQMAATVAALARSSAVVWAKHGIVTRSDVSAIAAADLVEYLEVAAHYEFMNLSLGSPAPGLEPHERAAVARAFGVGV
jgi:rhamnulose-1-phosphate aldolase